jgi:hypothetical protein
MGVPLGPVSMLRFSRVETEKFGNAFEPGNRLTLISLFILPDLALSTPSDSFR